MMKINTLKLIILTFLLITFVSACGITDEIKTSVNPDGNIFVSDPVNETESSISRDLITKTTTHTNNSGALETSEFSDMEIVEAIHRELLRYNSEEVFVSVVDYVLKKAVEFPNRFLGTIASEEDVIEKVRPIFIELKGIDYIEKLESDVVDVGGKDVKYQRDKPPYETVFYSEYDVWYISINLPSGIIENGGDFATPGDPPYFIISAANGKILAIWA